MGRAIVREPQAFLMDEPLSNLDAKLRVSMRASLNQLHERLGVTTVYVTHDQVEAMTLGHRVCVLRDGKLQQVDTPQTLFASPVNLFVAGFIGSPAMNFVMAELVRDDGLAVTFGGHRLAVPESVLAAKPGLDSYIGREVILGIRPSDFEDAGLADSELAAHVGQGRGDGGARQRDPRDLHDRRAAGGARQHHRHGRGEEGEDEAAVVLAGGKSLWTARVAARSPVRSGQPVELAVDTSNLHFFDPVSGLSIGHPAASRWSSPRARRRTPDRPRGLSPAPLAVTRDQAPPTTTRSRVTWFSRS